MTAKFVLSRAAVICAMTFTGKMTAGIFSRVAAVNYTRVKYQSWMLKDRKESILVGCGHFLAVGTIEKRKFTHSFDRRRAIWTVCGQIAQMIADCFDRRRAIWIGCGQIALMIAECSDRRMGVLLICGHFIRTRSVQAPTEPLPGTRAARPAPSLPNQSEQDSGGDDDEGSDIRF